MSQGLANLRRPCRRVCSMRDTIAAGMRYRQSPAHPSCFRHGRAGSVLGAWSAQRWSSNHARLIQTVQTCPGTCCVVLGPWQLYHATAGHGCHSGCAEVTHCRQTQRTQLCMLMPLLPFNLHGMTEAIVPRCSDWEHILRYS